MSEAEQIRQKGERRAKIWKEHVANYQKVLDESPEAFSGFSEEFLERFRNAIHSDEKRKKS